MSPLCDDCGEDATEQAREYTGPDTYVLIHVCAECATVRDNREPPDPDGEEMFRDYAAESRDAMAEARKLK